MALSSHDEDKDEDDRRTMGTRGCIVHCDFCNERLLESME